MTRKLLITLTVTLGVCFATFAQQLRITGTVKDHTGLPVAGATILVGGSASGTTSNADGSFVIEAPEDGTLLTDLRATQDLTVTARWQSDDAWV